MAAFGPGSPRSRGGGHVARDLLDGDRVRMDLRGRHVQFAIRDIFVPTPEAVLHELHGSDLMDGEVVELARRGDAGVYAVVKVPALTQPVVVAIDRIHVDGEQD
jgi:hypothetical protein